jgi:predicted transcriptional regulator of viral defense system
MASKTEALYNALLPIKIASFDDIINASSRITNGSANRKYVYRKYVKRLIETNKLQTIRRGLYAVLSPLEKNENYEPDKLLIASKIRKEHYLGLHTALEYYGCAYSAFNEAYICVQARNRFDPFNYKRFMFKPIFVKDTESQVIEKPHGSNFLRVSSKERTFIESVDRVRYAGGWEECVKSLENLRGLDIEKLISLTLEYGKKGLPRRVGFILELLRNRSSFYEHVTDTTLSRIAAETKGAPQYLIRGKKGGLNRRWGLYIPESFEEQLRGS